MGDFEPVLRTPELGPGEIREVEAHGEMLALLNVGQTYYALDARCPSDDTNLARVGRLSGDHLECPVDHATYDVRTGERVDDGDGPGLRMFAIEVSGNEIRVGPAVPPETKD